MSPVIFIEKELLRLMYNNKDVWDFISRNKPAADRSIDLQVDLCLYYLSDGQTWYSVDQYTSDPDTTTIPWQDFVVTVTLDDTVLYSGSPTQLTQLRHRFQDSSTECRVFKILVQGVSSKHNTVWPGTDKHGSAALRVNGHIDNIPLNLLMPKFGKYVVDTGEVKIADDILCENGHQVMEIVTPFYTWLHQNKDQIIWELLAKHQHADVV